MMIFVGDRRSQLPARDLWKNTIVRSGTSSASVGFIVFNKKARGAAGTNHFVLLTGACPQVGIFDAEVIDVYLEHLEDRAVPY